MQSKLDSVLHTAASCCVTFATLVLGFGIMGLPLQRPWIAYGSLGIGLLTYVALVMRGLDIRSALGAVAVYGAFGAASGAVAIAIGRAIASKSWGLVTALLLMSMLIGGISIWWNARRRNLAKE